MGAVLNYPEIPKEKWAECLNLCARFTQPLRVCSAERFGAERIVKQIDQDAGPCALDENGSERLSDLAWQRVIHLHIDRGLGGAQIGPETWKNIAGEHKLDLIARRQCRARQQRHGEREPLFVWRHGSAVDADGTYPANGGASGDVEDPDDRRNQYECDQRPVEEPPSVLVPDSIVEHD